MSAYDEEMEVVGEYLKAAWERGEKFTIERDFQEKRKLLNVGPGISIPSWDPSCLEYEPLPMIKIYRPDADETSVPFESPLIALERFKRFLEHEEKGADARD